MAAPNPHASEPARHPELSSAGSGLVLEQGQVLAKKYVLDRPAGFGGMAQLWVATNQSTAAEVCIKLLVPDPEKGGHDPESVERFRREAHAAARLSHRAIVRVFDLLELDENGQAIPRTESGAPYAYAIVMELLHGETLADMLGKRGKIPLEEALDLFLPILSALGHAHRADVVHRDLKPDNIFLAADPDGHVTPKVLDFGVSKLVTASALTIDGVIVGTPSFMSPEQARGSRQIDARSDVFSAGILFYLMLTGRNPFEDAPTFASVVDAIVRRQVAPPPDVPPAIWEVIDRAIAKDPAQRFEDAREMNNALRSAAGRRAVSESDPMISLPPAPPSGRSLAPPAPSQRPRPPTTLAPPPVEEERRRSDAARQRRAIVAGVVGVASALIVAAGLVSVLGSGPTTSAPAPTPSTTPVPLATTKASPDAPESAPSPSTSSNVTAASATVAPVMTATNVATSAPRPSATVRRAPTSGPRPAAGSASATTRRPGEEPHKARDPGF